MSSDVPKHELIEELREAFNEAESEIHKTESITQKSPVSALNELRYAGSHMLVFLQENEPEELNQAVMHGRRAFYDTQRFLLQLFCFSSPDTLTTPPFRYVDSDFLRSAQSHRSYKTAQGV